MLKMSVLVGGSFEIVHHEIREDEVLVLAKLSAEGISKMQFGVSQVTREKGSGQPVSLGDDLKAAATDALKKCATCLGVGLHLYADKPLGGRAPSARPGTAPPRPPIPHQPATGAPTPPSPPSVNGDGAPSEKARVQGNGATPRQLDAIWKVAQAKGLEPAAVESMSLRVFNRKPEALAREEAAGLIKELSNMKRSAA